MKAVIGLMLALSLMSVEHIADQLSRRAAEGADPQTLWNLGFELYYRQGFNQKEMAGHLAKAYAEAVGETPQQQRVLRQAARFWARERAYFDRDVVPRPVWPEDGPGRPLVPGTRTQPEMKMFPAPRHPAD